ncbi:MAG: hypothetical protein ACI4CT_04560 [Lachnospiraceae bacterium]
MSNRRQLKNGVNQVFIIMLLGIIMMMYALPVHAVEKKKVLVFQSDFSQGDCGWSGVAGTNIDFSQGYADFGTITAATDWQQAMIKSQSFEADITYAVSITVDSSIARSIMISNDSSRELGGVYAVPAGETTIEVEFEGKPNIDNLTVFLGRNVIGGANNGAALFEEDQLGAHTLRIKNIALYKYIDPVLLPPATASEEVADNVLVNGNFANDLTGWESRNGTPIATRDRVDYYIETEDEYRNLSLSQNVTLKKNSNYTITYTAIATVPRTVYAALDGKKEFEKITLQVNTPEVIETTYHTGSEEEQVTFSIYCGGGLETGAFIDHYIGISDVSIVREIPEAIKAPGNIVVSVTGDNKVMISYDPSSFPSLEGYRIYQNDEVIATIMDTSYTISDLPSGTYTIAVSAFDSEGNEAKSSSYEIVIDKKPDSNPITSGGVLGYAFPAFVDEEPDTFSDPTLESIRIHAKKTKLEVGKQTKIQISLPESVVEKNEEKEVTYKIRYRTNQSKVIKVNRKTGTVTAKRTGTAKVIAQITFSNGQTAQCKCKITVKGRAK